MKFQLLIKTKMSANKEVSLILSDVVCLFDLIQQSLSYIVCRDGSSWVEPVLSKDQRHKAVMPMRLLDPWPFGLESSTPCADPGIFISGGLDQSDIFIFFSPQLILQKSNG